jgi:hypothetical protein
LSKPVHAKPRRDVRVEPITSLMLLALLSILVLAGGIIASLLPAAWAGFQSDTIVAHQTHFTDRFFPWDSVWYDRAARDGYRWDAAHPGEKQDIAFFPLWPLVLRCILLLELPNSVSIWITVGVIFCIAWASIYQFQCLATRVLPQGSARFATALYAFYPGAIFLLKSYPTALQNLLTLLCLSALLNGKMLRAALLSGAATACGPLGVAAALTTCAVAATRAGRPTPTRQLLRRAPAFLAYAIISFSGLLGFMAYQWIALGTPTAFMAAQWAWHPGKPFAARLIRAVFMVLTLPDFLVAASRVPHAITQWAGGAHRDAQAYVQNGLNSAALGVALFATWAASWHALRRRAAALPWPLLLQACATLLAYVWFVATLIDGWAALRLIFPALAPFFFVATLLARRPWLRTLCVALSACLLLAEEIMLDAGYLVV